MFIRHTGGTLDVLRPYNPAQHFKIVIPAQFVWQTDQTRHIWRYRGHILEHACTQIGSFKLSEGVRSTKMDRQIIGAESRAFWLAEVSHIYIAHQHLGSRECSIA